MHKNLHFLNHVFVWLAHIHAWIFVLFKWLINNIVLLFSVVLWMSSVVLSSPHKRATQYNCLKKLSNQKLYLCALVMQHNSVIWNEQIQTRDVLFVFLLDSMPERWAWAGLLWFKLSYYIFCLYIKLKLVLYFNIALVENYFCTRVI